MLFFPVSHATLKENFGGCHDVRSRFFLHKLKRLQIEPDYLVNIDFATFEAISWNLPAGAKPRTLSFSRYRHSIYSILSYLQGMGFLEKSNISGTYHVTHTGWHHFDVAIRQTLAAVFKSFVLPVVVSVLTTLATLWANGFFEKLLNVAHQ